MPDEKDILEVNDVSTEDTSVVDNTVPGESDVENGVPETQVQEEYIKEGTEVSEEVSEVSEEVTEVISVDDLQGSLSTDELLTSDEFNTAMEELIALQEVQIEGLQYMYSSQLFCIGVLAVLLVCILLHKVIKIFL